MILQDFHTHTSLSDGADSPEELAQAAVSMGMTCLGISDHAYTPFDESYCLAAGSEEAYRRRVHALRERFQGRIRILCGIEQDFYAPVPAEGYDYVIGSVHFLRVRGRYIPVDLRPELLSEAARDVFDGDIYALVETYYETVSQVVERTGADLIGHFDIITKFLERVPLFDTQHPRCLAAWQTAADALLKTGKPFEINTGAMSRGYRTSPYPAPEILSYLRARGARFLLSSDCHEKEALMYRFSDFEPYASCADFPERRPG